MLYRVIDATEIPQLVQAFMDSYEVVAPVQSDQGYVFSPIESPDDVVLNYVTTISSPKKYILPSEEDLLRFNAQTNEVTDYEEHITPRVLFGVHACDINALNRLDLVFKDCERPDPYYVARRRSTLVVGVSCVPGPNCFCRVWGSDEARFGYDLFLSKIGDSYLVSISSVEAANILEASCHPRLATDDERFAFRQAARHRQESFNHDIPKIQDVALLMDAFHDDPFWEELGSKCLSCTACSAVCPSCFCFDLVDELDPDGVGGSRRRVWDSCTSPQFAQVTGGFNFRATPCDRVRHRMYHKLNGFLATHDRMLCVGCGRCVMACKADINPIKVLKFFEEKGADRDE